ncbi:MAG: type II secretion system protein [Candidatus Omnitrophota bacterium]|nr:MAG: type II secretion system protein [Candidatus Omnitrophota bacterium]
MKKKKGFTLIELVMTAVILSIIALAGAPLMIAVNEGWLTSVRRNEFSESARIAMDRMVRLIRRVKDEDSVFIADSSIFQFINSEDNIITFDKSANILRLSVDDSTNDLAADVSLLEFTYFDKDGAIIAIPKVNPASTNVRRIQIDLVFSFGTEQLSFRSQVAPRRIQ